VAERRSPNPVLRAGLHAVNGLSRLLGPLRYNVADAIALGVYAAQPQRRSQAIDNHRRSDPGIDAEEARRRARASFREYARTTADFFWVNAIDVDQLRARTQIVGLHHVEEASARGRGAVVALGHFGNWDMAGKIATAHGYELTTVMAPLGGRQITDLLAWARERNRIQVFTPENAARGLVRALHANRLVGILCDIPGAGPTVTVQFCGGPVEFSAVPARLARRVGTPLLPVDCERVGHSYRVEVHPPVPVEGAADAAVMQAVAAAIEPAVRRRPAQWYPFGTVYAE